MSTQISIRTIQHYLYCPHRWGLLEIDGAWEENIFVTKANLMHERVHDPDKNYSSRGKRVFTSVSVYNDIPDYGLYGVTDCIEGTEDKDGVRIFGSDKLYNLCIVEYKQSKPKGGEYNYEDLMQIFAQKICTDYVFGGSCRGQVYYADVKKRFELPLNENFAEYDKSLKSLLKEMRLNIQAGRIPPVKKSQKCGGCSLKDICMPQKRGGKNMELLIKEMLEDDI